MREPDPELVGFIEHVIPRWCTARIEEHRGAVQLRPHANDIISAVQDQMCDLHPGTHRERRKELLRTYFHEEITRTLHGIVMMPMDYTFTGVLRDAYVLSGLGIVPYDPRPSATLARLDSVLAARRSHT